MSRALVLAVLVALVASASAQEKGWTDQTVKLRADAKLGTKQAGGLLRDGTQLRLGQAFTVKSDDGIYIELVGETGFLFKTEVDLFVGREMPKKGAPAPKVDPKELWASGSKVLPTKSASQIQFGDRDENGKATYFTLTGISFTVVRDNGDGWVRVRDRYREGWVNKDDILTKEAALDHFDKMVKANPQNAWALFMRAASNNESGKHDAAIEDYTAYLKLTPTSTAAMNNRGIVWLNKKDNDKAIEDFTAAIKLDAKYTIAYSNRASALLNKKEYEKSVEDCDKAIELDPKYGLAFTYRARALAKLKKYDEAKKDFETAIKLDPTSPRYNVYAWFLATCPDEKHRDGKKAVELATKGIEQSGKDVSWGYRDTLAAAHAAAGDFEKAVAEQQKALESKTPTADDRKKMEARLELYKAKKPYRDDE